MRPTGGLIATVATAIIATKTTHAFVPRARASSCRAGATSQHQPRQDTCSAIDNRRFRRASAAATTVLPASATAQAAAKSASEAAEGGLKDAGPSCSLVGEEGEEEEEEEGRPQQRWRWAAGGARRALLRGAASFATFSVGATALSGMSADLQHRLNAGRDGATVMSVPGAVKSAEASVFKPFEKRTVEEKLANLPAFMVTNANGSPYLSPTEPNEPQVCMHAGRHLPRSAEEEQGTRGTKQKRNAMGFRVGEHMRRDCLLFTGGLGMYCVQSRV